MLRLYGPGQKGTSKETQVNLLTAWLLEPDNPSVRFFTLRDLLGQPEDDPHVQAARAAMAQSRVVQRILSRQQPGGHWGDPPTPYLPKYKATYWTVMLLGQLGLTREDERVQRAVEYLFAFQQPNGGFAETGAEGARRKYHEVVDRLRQQGKQPPGEAAFIADYVHQGTMSCLTGNMVAALCRLGYGDDARLWRAVDWLLSIQRDDGGWLCPYWKAHLRDKHSCFHGAICALEGLAEIAPARRSAEVRSTIERAAEFLLMHRLYRSDHRGWKVINARWLRLAFPWFVDYSVLRGLWVLTRLGVQDERMEDALKWLQQARLPDGRWPLESTPYGRMQANLGRKGQPSKWITLKALQVLERTQG
jgi:hypothetical protein